MLKLTEKFGIWAGKIYHWSIKAKELYIIELKILFKDPELVLRTMTASLRDR
jgi:hypothetical protein